jgi:hypothetical protein
LGGGDYGLHPKLLRVNRKIEDMVHLADNRSYSLRFKMKVTFGHKLRYEIKVMFGEISLELRQTN